MSPGALNWSVNNRIERQRAQPPLSGNKALICLLNLGLLPAKEVLIFAGGRWSEILRDRSSADEEAEAARRVEPEAETSASNHLAR